MHISNVVLFLNLGSGEIFLVVMCILMFFGADKLPEMARALGKGMREMKNATAEIQREIENSTTEIQRDINVKGHLDELKEATDKITGRLNEGLNDLEEHHNPKDETVVVEEKKEEETENPLVPPTSVKRD